MNWLALHLPLLSLEVYERGLQAALPLAVSQRERLVVCNPLAQAQGVRPGLAESAGRALLKDLRILPRNEDAERAALERLAAWAMRFSDQVSLEPPRALVLESARSLRLFGGADALHRQVAAGIAELGYRGHCVLAPTPAGALVLAATGAEGPVPDIDALHQALSALPVAALGFERRALDDLARMGLKRIQDLLRLPRDGFAERFGIERLYQLERMLGERADPRRPFTPPTRFSAELELPAEVPDAAALVFAGRRLLDELCGFLLARQAGVQRLSWRLYHADIGADTDRGPTCVRLGCARPERDPRRWLELLRERLERLRLPAPVRAIALSSETLRPLAPANGELFANAALEPDPALLDRLRARLGSEAVRGLALVADQRPERAWRWCGAGDRIHDRASGGIVRGDRPLWLLPEPVVLPRRAQRPWLDGPLDLGSGCERIETGWWDDFDVARDYYVATAASGERLWIYREMYGERRWFLHGLFGVG